MPGVGKKNAQYNRARDGSTAPCGSRHGIRRPRLVVAQALVHERRAAAARPRSPRPRFPLSLSQHSGGRSMLRGGAPVRPAAHARGQGSGAATARLQCRDLHVPVCAPFRSSQWNRPTDRLRPRSRARRRIRQSAPQSRPACHGCAGLEQQRPGLIRHAIAWSHRRRGRYPRSG